jgi:hypothetical protein
MSNTENKNHQEEPEIDEQPRIATLEDMSMMVSVNLITNYHDGGCTCFI